MVANFSMSRADKTVQPKDYFEEHGYNTKFEILKMDIDSQLILNWILLKILTPWDYCRIGKRTNNFSFQKFLICL